MTTNRLGKIGRLPLKIRKELNERLADNVPNQRLVRWLNSLPEVKEVLEDLFDGRPISQQNLSAWKQGAFKEWERSQETRTRAHDFLDEARELAEEINEPEERGSLLDRVGDQMALMLLQLLREVEQGEKGPARTREMLEITRELLRLRRADRQRQRATVVRKRWRRNERDAMELEQLEKTDVQSRPDKAAQGKTKQKSHSAEAAHAPQNGDSGRGTAPAPDPESPSSSNPPPLATFHETTASDESLRQN